MNKPAAKEPSMDEILSSIRQIIADEDQDVSPAVAPKPESTAEEALMAQTEVEDAPLALSPDQMVRDPDPETDIAPAAEPEQESVAEAPVDENSLLAGLGGFDIPEDVEMEEPSAEEPAADETTVEETTTEELVAEEFAAEVPAAGPVRDMEETSSAAVDYPIDDDEEPGIVLPDDIAFDEDAAHDTAHEEPAAAAPMPDPDLSSDMAEKLLEPTTSAATKHAFSRLNQLAVGSSDMTIENMVREMLRPMLKDWLDENLPSVVEKLVEREIERISRGS